VTQAFTTQPNGLGVLGPSLRLLARVPRRRPHVVALYFLHVHVPSPRTPGTPISPSGLGGSPGHAARFGRAAVLTAPPRQIAIIETPDVAVGAVDPRKWRVVTVVRCTVPVGITSTHTS
jgi:hypothetical protein